MPFSDTFPFQIVVEVLKEFFIAATCHTKEFQFYFCRGLSVAAAFSDVLFGAACALYHLIYRAVTVFGQIFLAEYLCQLIEHIAALKET